MKLTKSDRLTTQEQGFTLIEVMIVVAIIAILSAIVYPSYQEYIKKTKRTDMMTELQNISAAIVAQKLTKGSFTNIKITDLGLNPSGTTPFPKNEKALYNVTITPIDSGKLSSSKWTIIATPTTNTIMKDDGDLSINFKGEKCHKTQCGQDDAWRR